MPAPLIWLSAALAGVYAGNKANTNYLKRKQIIGSMPGESKLRVTPVNGSIVCCGIYGVLDHTGIWIDNTIYELSGEGLVRCLSPNRFLGKRSGSTIYVACDANNTPLFEENSVGLARSRLYTLLDYHLFDQNCHRFVAETLAGHSVDIMSFSDLNIFLHQHFSTLINWHKASNN